MRHRWWLRRRKNADTIKLNKEATDAFKDKKYKEAAEKFTKASKTATTASAVAVLRKNAMISWFRADNCVKATEVADKFLDLGRFQKPKDKLDAQNVIGKCRYRDAQKAFTADKLDAADASLKVAAKYSKDPEDIAKIKALKKQVAQRRIELKKLANPPMTTQAIVGWSLVGTGSAVLIGNGVYSYLKNDSIKEQFDDCKKSGTLPKAGCEDSVIKDAESAQVVQYVVYATGAAMIIGGVVALVLDSPKDTAAAAWYPVVGPDQAGVGFHYRF